MICFFVSVNPFRFHLVRNAHVRRPAFSPRLGLTPRALGQAPLRGGLDIYRVLFARAPEFVKIPCSYY